jgi:hypothetical protein
MVAVVGYSHGAAWSANFFASETGLKPGKIPERKMKSATNRKPFCPIRPFTSCAYIIQCVRARSASSLLDPGVMELGCSEGDIGKSS